MGTKITDKQIRRMGYLEEDKECFGLTYGEEEELKQLKASHNTAYNNHEN